jgi:hypothetical protein
VSGYNWWLCVNWSPLDLYNCDVSSLHWHILSTWQHDKIESFVPISSFSCSVNAMSPSNTWHHAITHVHAISQKWPYCTRAETECSQEVTVDTWKYHQNICNVVRNHQINLTQGALSSCWLWHHVVHMYNTHCANAQCGPSTGTTSIPLIITVEMSFSNS